MQVFQLSRFQAMSSGNISQIGKSSKLMASVDVKNVIDQDSEKINFKEM